MKHIKYFLLSMGFTLALSATPNLSFAQQPKIIRGVVKDKSDQLPLPGANVIVKTENDRMVKGVTTDVDGRYAIEVTIPNAILQVTFIGYKATNIPITNQTTINVDLESDSQELGEVVVSAKAKPKVDMGYMQVQARDVTTAVSSINLKEVAPSSATSAIEMMQGRAAGVQITATSGAPGAAYTIRIRGNTSLNSSNAPLIVIDGVQYSGDIGGLSDVTELMTERSPLQEVHPDDIESIEVLKDAGSTAIYGARGANGVVLITTKRGRANYTQVSFSNNTSIQIAPQEIPLLSGDNLKVFILEGMQNRGNRSSTSINMVYPELRDDITRSDYYLYNNNTDWVKEVQQTGYTLNNNLSLSGGGNTTVYRFSLGSTNQTGTVVGTGYDRFSTQFNLDYNISKNMRLQTSIRYARSTTKSGGDDLGTGYQSILGAARQYPSFLPVYWRDESGNTLDKYYVPANKDITLFSQDMYNPVAWANLVKNNKKGNSFVSNVTAYIDILEGLTLRSNISIDFNNEARNIFIPSEATNRNWNDDKVNETKLSNSTNQMISHEDQLIYVKTFNEIHYLNLSAVARFEWNRSGSFYENATNTGSNHLVSMDATNRWSSMGSSRDKDAKNTWIGWGNYKLLDRYILIASISYEGSSRFGESNRFGLFPTASFSWRISGEPFMKNWEFLDDLRIRYSWGQAGNTPWDKYLYYNTYTSDIGQRYMDKSGTSPNNIQLNTLHWEVTATNNIGLDIEMFKSRIWAKLDLYKKYTNDLLMKRSLPSSSGFGDYWTNYGDVSNTGLEFEGRGRVVERKDLKVDLTFNISFIKNKIEYIPEDSPIVADWYNDFPFKPEEGDPIGAFYGYRYNGVYATEDAAVARDVDGNILYEMNGKPKTVRYGTGTGAEFMAGDAIYEDLNHDGLINDLDLTYIGNANPDFFGGFGGKVTWKNWTLDVFFQYQVGNDVVNLVRKDLESMRGGDKANINQSQAVMRRWRKQGDITDMPRVSFDANYNNLGSTRYIETGSYCRLKNLSISYSLPTSFANKIYMKRANVFFTAYNIYTFTNYTGQDPEIRSDSGVKEKPFRRGLDENRIAVPKSFTAGFNLTF